MQLLRLKPVPCPPAARPRLSWTLPWDLNLLPPVGVCMPAPALGEVKESHGMDTTPGRSHMNLAALLAVQGCGVISMGVM